MSPNQYVSDLRAERDALRATVARVEALAESWRLPWEGHAGALLAALTGPPPAEEDGRRELLRQIGAVRSGSEEWRP